MKQRIIIKLIACLGRLPLPISRGLGAAIGRLIWHTNARAKRVTCTNLRLCYGDLSEAKQAELARSSLIETAKMATEIGAVWVHDISWLKKHIVEVENFPLFQDKLAQNKGLIVIAPHLGNWEVVAPYVAGFRTLTALYQPSDDPSLDAFILASRDKPNVTMAPTNRRGVALLLKALKKGEMVGILPDQVPDPGSGGVQAPFFSEPTLTMTLVHSLMQRTQCNAIMVVAFRVKGGFKMVLQECDARLYSADQHTAVAGLNQSVENCVRLNPAQYQWEYKRFKGRDVPEPY